MEPIYNSVGAARMLECGVDNIHKMVRAGKLKARMYGPEGVLVERDPLRKQGQGLYFLQSDLDEFQKIRRKRSKSKKNA